MGYNNTKNTKLNIWNDNYNDDYINITDGIEQIIQHRINVKLGIFMFVYCTDGQFSIELNNSVFKIRKNDVLVCLPNSIVSNIQTDKNCKMQIVCFSNRFIHRMTQTEKSTWRIMEHLHTHPVKHLKAEERTLLKQYLTLMWNKMPKAEEKHQKDILIHIASALFNELLANTQNDSLKDNMQDDAESAIKQSNYIFNKFMESVMADNGKHRNIGYYADMLCYTPKYLSTIVKQVSGKNALKIINENAIEQIISELKFSEKNIKQIAFDFNFSNNSFFSKFFKKHMGCSPTEYRNNNVKEDSRH